jgi:hypothetical protein
MGRAWGGYAAMTPAFREALSRYASPDVNLVPRKGGGFTVSAQCRECGLPQEALSMGTLMNPQIIASKLRQRGWQIGHHNLCPDHKSKKRNDTMTAQLAPPASDKAREAKRLVMMSLDDYFDPATGQYRDGKGDAAIGRDCGLATSVVTKLREEFYGPLRAPTEFERLLAEARQRLADLDVIRSETHAAIGKLDSYAKAQGWV